MPSLTQPEIRALVATLTDPGADVAARAAARGRAGTDPDFAEHCLQLPGAPRVHAGVTTAMAEVSDLTTGDARRLGLDPAGLPGFVAQLGDLLDAGRLEAAAKVAFTASSLLLRAHARCLAHPATARADDHAAVQRIGLAMNLLAQEYGERALQGRVDPALLSGFLPERPRWVLRRRRSAAA